MTHLIEEAITEWFGERCPDYEYGCSTCDAWTEYDERVLEIEPVASLGERLIEAATEAVTMAKLMRENEELRGDVTAWMNACSIVANDLLVERGQLAEEQALGDRLYETLKKADEALHDDGCRPTMWPRPQIAEARAAYRKARGL